MAPAIPRPSIERLDRLASDLGLRFDEGELASYATLVETSLDDVDRVLDMRAPTFPRSDADLQDRPPSRPPDENPYNAWLLRCRVEGANNGPLSGMTVGLKDNIALAGYELTCASSLLSGFVPEIDATVVRRLLGGGATITGKLNMEAFSWSGSSDMSDFGPVVNPHDPDLLAGGSSSGSGVAVAVGDCDLALGGDQGGSIRIPSTWCGIVGLKPTRGLVPYTGIVPMDPTIDHVGPMARTVEDTARALEVLAGEDVLEGVRMDPRQPRGVQAQAYVEALESDVDGMTVGVLEEGFDWQTTEPRIDDTVRRALTDLDDRGVEMRDVSVPRHRDVLALITPMECQGIVRTLRESWVPTHQSGWNWTELNREFGAFSSADLDQLPPTAKHSLLVAAHLEESIGVEAYAVAKNVVLDLKRQYDRLLHECDALVMPTIPVTPFERDDDLPLVDRVERNVANHLNTAQFDHTHHPALTVPCGAVDGLPVGFQLVGAHFDEETLFRLAAAIEAASTWDPASAVD